MREEPFQSACRWDTFIECLMIGLLVFMPLAFGAVHAWSEMIVIILAAAMSIVLAMKLAVCRNVRFVWSWSYLPIVAFLLLVVVQMIPLPTGVVSAISPQTMQTKNALLGDLLDTGQLLSSTTLSFYPLATMHDLRIILAVAAVFVIVINVYRRPEQIRRLLVTIVIIGACVAVLALLQFMTGTEKIYWLVDSQRTPTGPFVNYNNYSQFMNLSIGAALGLVLLHAQGHLVLHRDGHHRVSQVSRPDDGFPSAYAADLQRRGGVRGGSRSPSAFSRGSTQIFKGSQGRLIWIPAAVFIVGAATVFLSGSRGGAISILTATVFTTLILAAKRSFDGRGWIMLPLVLGAFVSILYLGFDAIYDRMATLGDFGSAYDLRGQFVKGISEAWKKFPVVGAGLGTHEVFFPMFNHTTSASLPMHAENEYAQAAEETGIVGLALLGAFAVLIWFHYARTVRSTTQPIQLVAFGLGFSLIAIMVHSLSDFGQHLPANASLTAIFCGLLIVLSRMARSQQATHAFAADRSVTYAPRVSSFLRRFLAFSAIVLIWSWSLIGANSARAAEGHWSQALRHEKFMEQKHWQASNEEYAELISLAAAASASETGSVHYRHWLNVYRWRSISRVHDPETGELVITPLQEQLTRRIIDELNSARRICPTFGPTFSLVGQLELFILHDPAGVERIRQGFALTPNDSSACFVAGMLDAYEDKMDASMAKFRHALALEGGLFSDIADIYIRNIGRPDLAVQLAGEDTGRLFHVNRVLTQSAQHTELAEEARARAVGVLKKKSMVPDASAGLLAQVAAIYCHEGDYESAIECYDRALGRDYGQVDWRLAYARTLAAAGQNKQAIHEARLCLRLRPQLRAATKLIADLSVKK